MTQNGETQDKIFDWVIEKFPLAKQRKIGPDDSLLEDGIVESLGTLDIVLYLEEEFGIQVSDDEMVAEHFESVKSIAAFVESKSS